MALRNKTNYWPAVFIGLCLIVISASFFLYQIFFSPNVMVGQEQKGELLIGRNATFNEVVKTLKAKRYIHNEMYFRFVSRLMNYDKSVKPGRYLLEKDMGNRDAIRYLRSGAQEPVMVTFNNVRTLADLAPKITAPLMITPEEFLQVVKDPAIQQELGFNEATILALFIPNTYEMYWDISARELLNRMKYEYNQFWNPDRLQKAESLGMSPVEVSTLASIVQAETQKVDERPTVAGLYLNRLERGMYLQADPTLVFAAGDFSIRRVLDRHKKIKSPYNTYLNKGLPPGPINIPEISAISAVLNHEDHNYYYMCAKEDFSGYHNFARTLRQHNINARKWQNALNRARVYR